MSETLVVLALLACGFSGVTGLFFSRRTCTGQWITTVIIAVGCLLGLAGVGVYSSAPETAEIRRPWLVPGGEFHVAMDGLSALFLIPVFLMALLGSIYGLSYWKQTEHPSNGRKLRLFFGLLPAGMGLLVIARNGLLFLFGWEIMALSAFFLVTTEDDDADVRATGWIYLVATHVSTLSLLAVFALLRSVSGSFELRHLNAGEIGPSVLMAIMILSLIGFGLKAGVMPLHVWLPSSHAIAPSHVSAIMSGVIIKMGIYGLARVTSLLPAPPLEWGAIVLVLGAVSGILGVVYAIGQHDLKRLLAYHSIENIGIIVMGIGLALLGRALGRADWIVLGMSGALLHVLNHAFFKGLLFLSAGSVIHAVHTREIDHLGGLLRAMPRTAFCFLVGAVAICGLPPLNGFVSEFLIYLGLFQTLNHSIGPAFVGASVAAPALALIGALALACFVKVFGAVFLGTARSEHARHARESPTTMLGPMFTLVGCCSLIGLAPTLIAPLLMQAVEAWAPELTTSEARLTQLAPLDWISGMGCLLLISILLMTGILQFLVGRSAIGAGPTWGCGYAAPTARMQYTSSSFAEMLVGLFGWALRPRIKRPHNLSLFPPPTSFQSTVPDVVLEEGILPTMRFGAWLFSWFRILQQGSVQMYLLYIFLVLFGLLLWR